MFGLVTFGGFVLLIALTVFVRLRDLRVGFLLDAACCSVFAGALVTMFWLGSFRCPRCDRAFFDRNVFRTACVRCGLPKGATEAPRSPLDV